MLAERLDQRGLHVAGRRPRTNEAITSVSNAFVFVACVPNNAEQNRSAVPAAAEARRAGLELRDTTLVIFGSPAAGTPVMVAVPLAAVDLPLKVLVWDDGGQAKVSYDDPSWLAARHHLSDD